MTYAADPASLQGAVAAGILGCGSVVLGTAELCGASWPTRSARRRRRGDGAPRIVAAIRARAAARCPGFGHPLHKPVDPRAERILALADERGRRRPALSSWRARLRRPSPRSGASRCR